LNLVGSQKQTVAYPCKTLERTTR